MHCLVNKNKIFDNITKFTQNLDCSKHKKTLVQVTLTEAGLFPKADYENSNSLHGRLIHYYFSTSESTCRAEGEKRPLPHFTTEFVGDAFPDTRPPSKNTGSNHPRRSHSKPTTNFYITATLEITRIKYFLIKRTNYRADFQETT